MANQETTATTAHDSGANMGAVGRELGDLIRELGVFADRLEGIRQEVAIRAGHIAGVGEGSPELEYLARELYATDSQEGPFAQAHDTLMRAQQGLQDYRERLGVGEQP